MSSLVGASIYSIVVGLSLIVGCSHSESKEAPAGDTIGIVIQAAPGLPKLQIRATFPGGFDPGPHVNAIATAIVGARTKCFTDNSVPEGVVVSVHGDVAAKVIHAVPKNTWGACLAHAIDGAKLDDPGTYPVDLQINVAEGAGSGVSTPPAPK
jgi:hypothetical protein